MPDASRLKAGIVKGQQAVALPAGNNDFARGFLYRRLGAFRTPATITARHNPLFGWFSGPWITYGLGIIMPGMGITLPAPVSIR